MQEIYRIFMMDVAERVECLQSEVSEIAGMSLGEVTLTEDVRGLRMTEARWGSGSMAPSLLSGPKSMLVGRMIREFMGTRVGSRPSVNDETARTALRPVAIEVITPSSGFLGFI